MNSLNKNGPIIVFTIGIALLLFSMRSFFYPQAGSLARIVSGAWAPPSDVNETRAPNEPDEQSATDTQNADAGPIPSKHMKSANAHDVSAPSGGYVVPAFDSLQLGLPTDRNTSSAIVELTQRLASAHLQSVGLQMRLPEGMQFGEQTDGAVRILLGSSAPGKIDLYLFSVSGRYPVDKAQQYLKEYFQDLMKLTLKGPTSSYDNRGGFNDGTLIKGINEKGEEVHAFYFRDGKSNRTHGLVLIDKQLGKRPAFLRQMYDSIRRP